MSRTRERRALLLVSTEPEPGPKDWEAVGAPFPYEEDADVTPQVERILWHELTLTVGMTLRIVDADEAGA